MSSAARKTVGGKGGVPAGKTVVAKRHQKKFADALKGITKPALRRLARRAGVKRITAGPAAKDDVYEALRKEIEALLQFTLSKAIIYSENARRKTVNHGDVAMAFARAGYPIMSVEAPKASKGKKT